MYPITICIAALLSLLAVGLVLWVRFALAQVEAELSSFTGFDGLHFDI